MQGFRISFNIYADSAEEAKQAEETLIGFIAEHAQEGRAVSANKIIKAVANWKSNPFVRSQVINYFQ